MATNTAVTLDMPEAADLADLTGIEYDLTKAKEFALTLESILASNNFDHVLAEALTTAMLVMYIRAFDTTGTRKFLLDEQIFSENLRENHFYFKNIRNKHIAHSENCFEESVPEARYWIERVETEGITGISCGYARVIALGAEDVDDLINLVEVLLQFVTLRIREEEKRLLIIVRAMPLRDVLSRSWRPINPGTGPVNKARTRLGS